jgi:hypothetical protein
MRLVMQGRRSMTDVSYKTVWRYRNNAVLIDADDGRRHRVRSA